MPADGKKRLRVNQGAGRMGSWPFAGSGDGDVHFKSSTPGSALH
jgi:hypothetical protein